MHRKLKSFLALTAAALALTLCLCSCESVLNALVEAALDELSIDLSDLQLSEETGESALPLSSVPDPALSPSLSGMETPSLSETEPSVPAPSTPTPVPTPSTPTPVPTPEDTIPFENVPAFLPYTLPKETLTDPIEKEASLLVDDAVAYAASVVTALQDDRHAKTRYPFMEDPNGYVAELTDQQKKLYADLAAYGENFLPFTMNESEYGSSLLTDALSISQALELYHPDVSSYFTFTPNARLTGITDRYFDPEKDANANVSSGKATMQQIEHDANLLRAVIRRAVKLMPEGLSTYDRYLYLALVVCQRATYDATAENCFTPYGALITGRCVCEGYSQAFFLLCREANLYCAYRAGMANGGGHIWNMIRLDSGYYNLDVTWCDGRKIENKNWFTYFIKSDAAFAKDHNATDGVKGTGTFEPCPYEKA